MLIFFLEAVSDENRTRFSRVDFHLKINISPISFWIAMGRIKCNSCFKKICLKVIFAHQIALRVERSDTAQNPNFRTNF
jgi:hypothetical protein